MRREFCQELRARITKGNVLEHELMGRHTSFQVGGPADIFVQPASAEEIRTAACMARKEQIPFFVAGNGSNLLVSDSGFRGMILQIGKNFQDITVDGAEICAQSGALLSKAAREASEHGLSGLEFAAGIPGSVGGAAAMNAGAYGGEMKDVVTEAEILTAEGEFRTLKAEEMDFSYRHSRVFDEGYIVLSVRFRLKPGDRAGIRRRMDELARARREKQPLEYPSAGSTFKRPEGYFAGKLIEDAGLKGYTVGGAQVSEKHAGFVINRGGADASEILFLIRQVQKKIWKQFGVRMEPEVRLVGFSDAEVRA